MSKPFQPIKTAEIEWQDGCPYAKSFDDIYYSRENGLDESHHVFIAGNDLESRWQAMPINSSFVIAETGFGTGLNFLLTMKLWHKMRPNNEKLFYYACEKHPLVLNDLKSALSSWPELADYAQLLYTQYPTLTPGFHTIEFPFGIHLVLIFADAEESLQQLLPGCAGKVDSWYLDGFAPSKNKSMWTPRLFNLINKLSHEGTQLSTFSCARDVKDGLIQSGFIFEKIKGYGNKREMIKAILANPRIHSKNYKSLTVWQFGHRHIVNQQRVIVIGAGLAGCMISFHLALLGWKITLIDKNSQPGLGASANPRAVLFPTLSAFDSPLSQLMLQSYLFAIKFYQNIDFNDVEHQLNGMILLDEGGAFSDTFSKWLVQLKSIVSRLSEFELSQMAGLDLSKSGLWFPHSGWINSNQLCKQLIQHENIQFIGNTPVEQIKRYQNQWQVNDVSAETLVLANGWNMRQYSQTQFIPLRAIKGQMTTIKSSNQSKLLRVPICGNGHVLPEYNGEHFIGATYRIDEENDLVEELDDFLNLQALQGLPIDCDWSEEIIKNWAGIRTTTNDYMPVVGAIPNVKQFLHNFKRLESDSNRYIENLDPFEPNLYAFTGFGSKGLTTIPLCANFLAKMITNMPLNLSGSLLSSLAPSRFLYRLIVRRKNEQIDLVR